VVFPLVYVGTTTEGSHVVTDVDPQELARLGDALARPSIRKSFAQDPMTALERAGVQIERVPPEVVDLFAELSPWELEVVGRVAAQSKAIPGLERLRDHVGVIIH
jgi:hypothetical protein